MLLMDEEKNRKWSVATYGSVQDAIKAMGENYGKLSLHFNTAVLMFCLSPEDVQETWVSLFERAKRMEDDRTILERVRTLAIAAELIPEEPPPRNAKAPPRLGKNRITE